ncbi:unnamed protein product, partial [Cuscuta epithymum]
MVDRNLQLQIPVEKHFPAQYTVCSKFKDVSELLSSGLSIKQMEIFHNTPWGHLLGAGDIKFSGQIIHLLLLHLAKNQPKDELWFVIKNQLFKFIFADFCNIIGIK